MLFTSKNAFLFLSITLNNLIPNNGNNIILLSYFKKMTQKTPQREIKKAKKYMKDYIERSKENE